jgi:hypothetical protein
MDAAAENPGAPGAIPRPRRIITTLFELIAAINEQVDPGEDDLVLAAVLHLWQTSRVSFLGEAPDGAVFWAASLTEDGAG